MDSYFARRDLDTKFTGLTKFNDAQHVDANPKLTASSQQACDQIATLRASALYFSP